MSLLRSTMAFVPTRDFQKSRAFYEGILGLRLTAEDGFALLFDSAGVMLRLTKVGDFQPQKFTILGWEVSDMEQAVSELGAKGVAFQHYGLPGQDERGIWASPSGDKVAWFKDPDGNVLSLTQFA